MIISKAKTCNTVIMLKTMSHMFFDIKSKAFGSILTVNFVKLSNYFIRYSHFDIYLNF